MYRILSRRRLTVLAATGAAAALVSTAASATKVGLPGAPAPVPAPRTAEWATTTTGTGAISEGDGAGNQGEHGKNEAGRLGVGKHGRLLGGGSALTAAARPTPKRPEARATRPRCTESERAELGQSPACPA